MENRLVYEHPLSERIRTLLRIENLFSRLDHYSGSPDLWDVRLTVSLLIDLNETQGTTAIVITHDHAIATQCRRLIQIRNGRLQEQHPLPDAGE